MDRAHEQQEHTSYSTGGWVCPSTRAFVDEARRTPGYSFFDLAHGYVYGRWPYLYIAIGTGEHWLSKPLAWISRVIGALIPRRRATGDVRPTVADGYHGKVVPLSQAKRLVSIDQDIRFTDLEQVIPFDRARDIILKNPQHIVVIECPCRSARPEPCLPLDVCLVIGEPFAGFVLEHHPQRARSITSAEAQRILAEEHDRGHVHHAFFKDAMFGRFYAICNCCPCCCGAMQAMRNGTPMLISSGYVSRVDESLCIGCGDCDDACPFEALTVEDGVAVIDGAKCMGCGVCVDECEVGALSLVLDEGKPAPLEIETLINAG
jgi:ferredoxin